MYKNPQLRYRQHQPINRYGNNKYGAVDVGKQTLDFFKNVCYTFTKNNELCGTNYPS